MSTFIDQITITVSNGRKTTRLIDSVCDGLRKCGLDADTRGKDILADISRDHPGKLIDVWLEIAGDHPCAVRLIARNGKAVSRRKR